MCIYHICTEQTFPLMGETLERNLQSHPASCLHAHEPLPTLSSALSIDVLHEALMTYPLVLCSKFSQCWPMTYNPGAIYQPALTLLLLAHCLTSSPAVIGVAGQ